MESRLRKSMDEQKISQTEVENFFKEVKEARKELWQKYVRQFAKTEVHADRY